MSARALAISLVAIAALAACSEPARRYRAQGTVRGIDRGAGQILIDHQAIEGLMPAMVMSFDVANPAQLEGLAEGYVIEFAVVSDGQSFRADEIVVTSDESPEAGPSGFVRLVEVGAEAPPFELTDQDGRAVSLASLRGRPVVLDFVYTTCPGPCPILTASHVALQRRLSPAQRARTRFVSITIDPERDTPAALRSYAEAHGADLATWSFLTGSSDRIDSVLNRYGVGSVRAENGEIDHVVATFLIGADGRVRGRFLGLEHSAEKLAAEVAELDSE